MSVTMAGMWIGSLSTGLRHARAVALAAASVALLCGCWDKDEPEPTPEPATQPAPATQPSSQPATQPVAEQKVFDDYLDLVLERRPSFPTTQPLPRVLTVDEAEKLQFPERVYLDPAGNLWITHEDGRDPAELGALGRELRNKQTFITDRDVEFAWWKTGPDGDPFAEIIARDADGTLTWSHLTGRAEIDLQGAEPDWSRAIVWNESIVVPTRGGMALLTPEGRPENVGRWLRRHGNLPPEDRPKADGTVGVDAVQIADTPDVPPTQFAFDGVGLLAWIPWDHGTSDPGGDHIVRFVDGAWATLPADDGWAERPVHLMPMPDGSVLQLSLESNGNHALNVVRLNEFDLDPAAVERLVADLKAYDRPTRDAAYAQLSGLGSAAWPILEELLPTLQGRVAGEVRSLLGGRDEPSLGGIYPEPGPVLVRQRLADGGAIIELPDGAEIPGVAGISVLQKPATIIIRPGRRVAPVGNLLLAELDADAGTTLFSWGDQFVITRPQMPPRLWGINHFADLLGEKQTQWQHFVGIDSRGRWLFRESGDEGTTLVIDVRVPDPTPQLPTWVIETGELGQAGWDDENYPAQKLGGVWRLLEATWDPKPPETEVHTRDTVSGAWELAIGPDGRSYYDGMDELRIAIPGEGQIVWPLPAEAKGVGERNSVKLAVDDKGRLFLFNRPGRVVRIEPTEPGSPQPYEVIGVFDEQIPGAVPRRVWIDPVGRVCAAYFGDTIVVMWPDGQVPAPIRQMMPAPRRDEGPMYEGA